MGPSQEKRIREMKPGDKVKVVRIDDYTKEVCETLNAPTHIGMVGTIEEIRYNKNMSRTEVIVNHNGEHYIWEPWNLMLVAVQ